MSSITITQKQYDLIVEAADLLRKNVEDFPQTYYTIEALKNLTEFLLVPTRI